MNNWIAAVILGLALVSSASAARPHFGHDGGLMFLDVMADRLGLTESQEAEIDSLVNNARLENAVDRERLSQLRQQLHEMSAGGDEFDEAGIEALAAEMAQHISRMAVSGARLRWQVQQVLTEEQRDQLSELRGGHHPRFVHGPGSEF